MIKIFRGKCIAIFSALIIITAGCKKETQIEQMPQKDLIKILTPEITFSSLKSVLSPIDTIYASFSLPIDTIYTINDHGVDRLFKLELTNLKITQSDSIKFTKVWETKQKLTIINIDNYRSSATYGAIFDFSIQEQVNGNWKYIKSDNNADNYKLTIIKQFNTNKLSSIYENCDIGSISVLKNLSLTSGIYPVMDLKHILTDTFYFSRTDGTYGVGKPELAELSIYENGSEYASTKSWTEDKLRCSLLPNALYKSNTAYKVVLKINYLERKSNQWIPLLDVNGKTLVDSKELQFTTGILDGNLISKENISYTYPLDRQHNFYKFEYNKGYYMFNYDLDKMPQVKNVADIKIRYTKYPLMSDTTVISTNYETATKTLWYPFPSNLENEKIYKVEMLSQNKVIHVLNFRVSKYNSIISKVKEDVLTASFVEDNGLSLGAEFGNTKTPDEHFDPFEYTRKLIRITALVNNWAWYQGSSIQYIYNHYPIMPAATINIDSSKLGFPPLRSVEIWQTYQDSLTNDEINAGTVALTTEFTAFVVRTPYYFYDDYKTTNTALRTRYRSDSEITDPEVKKIYNTEYMPGPKSGNYPVLFEYVLPGKNIVTFSKTITIVNKFTWND